MALALLAHLSHHSSHIPRVGRKNHGVVRFCKFSKCINILFCYTVANSIHSILQLPINMYIPSFTHKIAHVLVFSIFSTLSWTYMFTVFPYMNLLKNKNILFRIKFLTDKRSYFWHHNDCITTNKLTQLCFNLIKIRHVKPCML